MQTYALLHIQTQYEMEGSLYKYTSHIHMAEGKSGQWSGVQPPIHSTSLIIAICNRRGLFFLLQRQALSGSPEHISVEGKEKGQRETLGTL